MNSRFLLIVALVTWQFGLGFAAEEISPKKELIVSPDLTDDTNTTDVKKEVENIREAIQGEIPIPTFLQLHDTSVVRTQIRNAVSQGKYEQGKSVPEDIAVRLNAEKDRKVVNAQLEGVNDDGKSNVRLNAEKDGKVVNAQLEGVNDDGKSNVRLNAEKDSKVVNAQQEVVNDDGKSNGIDDVDTSTKKDLSNTNNDPKSNDQLRPTGWHAHRLSLRDKHQHPLVLRDPNIHTILRFPIWFKLRRSFVRNFFAPKKV